MATRQQPSPSSARKKVAAPSKKAASSAKKTRAASTKTAPAPKEAAPKLKHKLVRDSFTIPKVEYAVLEQLKQRALGLSRPTKKGELLRAGIAALAGLKDAAFVAALNAVPSLKTGRPKQGDEPSGKTSGKKKSAKAA